MANAKTYNLGVIFGAKKASSFDKTLGKVNSSIKGIVKGAAGIAGAYVGISAVTNYSKASIQAAKEQIEAETKLQAILKNVPGTASNAAENLGKLADSYEKIGVVAADVSLAGMQQLATYQVQESTLATLTEGMTDLIAQQKGLNATQGDAVTIGNMIGKVMNGQTGALSKAGVSFTKAQEQILKFGKEEQKAATLAEVLKQNVGGVNKALADTDQGKIKQASDVWGSLQENIGRKILPMQAKFAGLALKMFPSIEKFAMKAMDKIGVGIEWVTNKIDFIPPIIKKITGKINEVKQRGINTLNTIKEGLKKANKALEPYKPTFKAIYDSGKKAFSAIGKGIKKAKDYLVTTGLSKAFDFLATNIIPAVGNAAEKHLPIIGKMLKSVGNIGKKTVVTIGKISSSLLRIPGVTKGIAIAFLGWKVGKTLISTFLATKKLANQIIVTKINTLKAAKAFTVMTFAKAKDKAETIALYAMYTKDAIVKVTKNIYGSVKAFGVMTFAKAKDKVATLAINAVYAKEKIILLANKAAVIAYNAAQVVMTGITKGITIAQWALNAAFVASPIGWVVLGIGALIVAGVALWKNWDTVKAKALDLWLGIKTAFAPVGVFFSGIWEGIKNGFKGFVNFIIGGINSLIKGINKISLKVPDWSPVGAGKSLGFNIPEIPMLAKGGIVQKATVAMTGEAGKEAVIPLESRKSNKMLSNVFSSALKNKNFGSESKEVKITYKNTNVFYGDVDKNEIKKATKENAREFKRDIDSYFDGKARVQLA